MRGGRRCAHGPCLVLGFTLASLLTGPAAAQPTAPRLFLSCPTDCYDKYLRQELNYFDFVRDPKQADFTLVVSRQLAANGGDRFSVTLVPSTVAPGGRVLVGDVATLPGTAAHAVRPKLAQLMLRLLYAGLEGREHVGAFELRVPQRDGGS
jgi:hypothetical protein